MTEIPRINASEVLSTTDLDNINDALGAIESAKEVINRAEQAGLDVVGQKQKFDELDSKLRAVRAAFFPNRV